MADLTFFIFPLIQITWNHQYRVTKQANVHKTHFKSKKQTRRKKNKDNQRKVDALHKKENIKKEELSQKAVDGYKKLIDLFCHILRLSIEFTIDW